MNIQNWWQKMLTVLPLEAYKILSTNTHFLAIKLRDTEQALAIATRQDRKRSAKLLTIKLPLEALEEIGTQNLIDQIILQLIDEVTK